MESTIHKSIPSLNPNVDDSRSNCSTPRPIDSKDSTTIMPINSIEEMTNMSSNPTTIHPMNLKKSVVNSQRTTPLCLSPVISVAPSLSQPVSGGLAVYPSGSSHTRSVTSHSPSSSLNRSVCPRPNEIKPGICSLSEIPAEGKTGRLSPGSGRKIPRLQAVVRRLGYTFGGNKSYQSKTEGKREKDFLKAYLKKFDADEVEVLKKVYKELSARNPGPGINKETFLQYFPLPGLWGERLFQRFDYKCLGAVDYEEFLVGIAVCCRGTKCERIHVLFQVFDLNGDGVLQKEELVAMLSNLPNLDRYVQKQCRLDTHEHPTSRRLSSRLCVPIVNDSSCHTHPLTEQQSDGTLSSSLYYPLMSHSHGHPIESLLKCDMNTASFHVGEPFSNEDNLSSVSMNGGDTWNQQPLLQSTVLPTGVNLNDDHHTTLYNKSIIPSIADEDYFTMGYRGDLDFDTETDNDTENETDHDTSFIVANDTIVVNKNDKNDIHLEKHHHHSFVNNYENSSPSDNSSCLKTKRCHFNLSELQNQEKNESHKGHSRFSCTHYDTSLPSYQQQNIKMTLTTDPPPNQQHTYIPPSHIPSGLYSDPIDVEAFVDKIIEECEFSDCDSLTFMEFKTWVERNDSILAMFSDCLHEEAWGLQGNALYRRSVGRNNRLVKRFNFMERNGSTDGDRNKRGVIEIRPDSFYKVKRLFTAPTKSTFNALTVTQHTQQQQHQLQQQLEKQLHHQHLSKHSYGDNTMIPFKHTISSYHVKGVQSTKNDHIDHPSIIEDQHLKQSDSMTLLYMNEIENFSKPLESHQPQYIEDIQPPLFKKQQLSAFPVPSHIDAQHPLQPMTLHGKPSGEEIKRSGIGVVHDPDIYPRQTREVLNLQLLDLIAASNPNIDVTQLQQETTLRDNNELLSCPSCGLLLAVCPLCNRRLPTLRLSHGVVVVECHCCLGSIPHPFYNCWHCHWSFAKASEWVDQCEPLYEGTLYKIGRHMHKWRRRYFVLVDNLLYYYGRKEDTKPRGFIFLEGCFVEPILKEHHDDHTMSLSQQHLQHKHHIQEQEHHQQYGHIINGSSEGESHPTSSVGYSAAAAAAATFIKFTGGGTSSNSTTSKFGFSIIHGAGKIPRRDLYAVSNEQRQLWMDSLRDAMNQQRIDLVYQLEELIGQGKFSVVHRAYTHHTKEEVAIKIIEKTKITGHERELLRSEIAILRLLRHPHVINFKEILDSRTTIHIVMEYVRGGELYDLLQLKKKLSEPHVNRIIFQLLSTVAYLHKCGIIHRDLKPENILLTDNTINADIKITDFGLSCICGPDELVTQPCGTLAYVAPEVLTLQGYNHKVDVWSSGVIMFLLLRGRLPFPVGRSIGPDTGTRYHTPLSFDNPMWSSISSSAKDLLRKLLQPIAEKRISAQDALQHIWIQNPTAVINEVSDDQHDNDRGDTQYHIHSNTKQQVPTHLGVSSSVLTMNSSSLDESVLPNELLNVSAATFSTLPQIRQQYSPSSTLYPAPMSSSNPSDA